MLDPSGIERGIEEPRVSPNRLALLLHYSVSRQ